MFFQLLPQLNFSHFSETIELQAYKGTIGESLGHISTKSITTNGMVDFTPKVSPIDEFKHQKSRINPQAKGTVCAKAITPPALGIHRNLEGVALPMIMIF